MISWKRVFLISGSFGAGFVVMLSLIVGGIYWYQTRPRPWNKSAITATYTGLGTRTDKTFIFHYILENNTAIDYELTDTDTPEMVLMFEFKEPYSLAGPESQWLKLNNRVFLAPKQPARVGIYFLIKYKGEDLKTDASREDREKNQRKLRDYLNKEWPTLNGFVLYDKKHRFQIDFPKGW